MAARPLVWVLLALWAAIYLWSGVSFLTTVPTGSGFTRGLNRVTTFFGWQLAAGVLAIVIWAVGGSLLPRSLARRLSRVPIALAALLAAFIVCLVAYMMLVKPAP